MNNNILLFGVLPLCLTLAGCAPEVGPVPPMDAVPTRPVAAPSPAAVASELRGLADAPVRLAWVQDLGDGTDTGLESANLRLMGFDSDDGLGPRAILPGPANYARPLITPGGDRVIFSDRQARKIFIARWDGSGLRALRAGLALTTWADPGGREWVYFGEEPGLQRLVPKVYRCLVDSPAQAELVWDRSPVGLNNFQVSGDGRQAGGVFPWPNCGVADLAAGGLHIYGKGCYPALAPDDSGLFWIFDGAHRNLLFFDTRPSGASRTGGADARWRVNINDAPGIGGYEVYYPRWSNRARFMVMTGPFKAGTGDNRIRGGGAVVEIYVGRFSADFRAIEQWVRVTYNQNADFYPDVWVAPEALSPAMLPATPPTDAAVTLPSDDLPPWPAARAGLVFAWANRAGANEIERSDALGGVVTCNIEPRGRARYGRNFEMLLDHGAFMAADEAARPALAACHAADAFTLEITVTPADTGARPPAVLCVWGAARTDWSLLLGERAGQAACMLRRADGTPGVELTLGQLTPGAPSHVIVTFHQGVLTAWINGVARTFDGLDDVDMATHPEYRMTFGAMPDGAFAWAGLLENVAVYERALSPAEVAAAFDVYARRPARRAAPVIAVVDARLAAAATVPAPAEILPYRRALAVNRYVNPVPVAGMAPPAAFLAAQWVILDGVIIPVAHRVTGQVYRLRLEEFAARPELEGERLIMEGDHWDLPLYFVVDQ